MRVFRLSVLLAATCFSVTAAAATLQELPGYSQLTVSTAFETYLSGNTAVLSQLAAQPELSKLILSRAALQQQLVDGKTSLEAIRKQYLPNKTTAKERDPSLFSQAQALLQRAIGAAGSETAQERAEEDIDAALNNANADDGSNAATTINDTTALLAYMRAHPEQRDALLKNPDILARLEQAGIDPADLRRSDARGDTPPNSGNSDDVATPAPAPEPDPILESYDINAIPQGDGLALDANGWPKYLKVPADCPAPQVGVSYEHSHKGYMAAIYSRGVPGSGIDANGTVTGGFGPHIDGYPGLIVESIWIRGQTLLSVKGDGSEELALPFNADNQGNIMGHGNFYTAAGALEAAIAYCPGDFSNFTPAGKPPLSAKCVAPSNAFHAAVEPYREGRTRADYAGNDITNCFVEPGERYYVNIRPDQEHCLNEYENCGSMLAAGIDAMHSFGSYPPYAGPCLENGPYPQNYRNRLCGESQPIRNGSTTGMGGTPLDPSFMDCRQEGIDHYWSCYDPQDVLPPQSYARTCSPDGTRITWTDGYRKPTSSRYICESKSVSRSMGQTFVTDNTAYEFSYETGGDGSGKKVVCAAHREGQFRERGAGHPANSGQPQAYPYKVTEQCQYSPDTKRYDWVMVERSHMVTPRTATANSLKSLPITPNHSGCKIGETVHTAGTRYINDCGSIYGKAVYECKAAPEPRNSSTTMLNSFHLVEGSALGLMRDGCTQTIEAP